MRKQVFSRDWGLGVLLVVLSRERRMWVRRASRPCLEDLPPPPGTSLKFLTFKAPDGFVVDASLWQPEAKKPPETTLVVTVHGSGGDYSCAPHSTLSRALCASGLAALAINTRQHGEKRDTDNFFDISRDIDASTQTARAPGYRSIVLQGPDRAPRTWHFRSAFEGRNTLGISGQPK